MEWREAGHGSYCRLEGVYHRDCRTQNTSAVVHDEDQATAPGPRRVGLCTPILEVARADQVGDRISEANLPGRTNDLASANGVKPRISACKPYRTFTHTLFSWVNSRMTEKPISRPYPLCL